MKFFALITVIVLVLGFGACNFGVAGEDAVTTTYYIDILPETTTVEEESQSIASEYETTLPFLEAETQQDENVTQETIAVFPETTTIVAETTTIAPETTAAAETTTVPEQTTKPAAETTTSVGLAEFTINMSVPDANGTMEVDLDENNKYTQIVAAQRGIDTSLLIAVYSVPESGQNYVFEFLSSGEENRTAENIRRVYLIDSSGKIAYVSAASSVESENVSVVENWFNMNVLIKGMIFPAIEEKVK